MNLVFCYRRWALSFSKFYLFFKYLSNTLHLCFLFSVDAPQDDDAPAAKRIKTEDDHQPDATAEDIAAVHAAANAAAAEAQAQQDAAAAAQLDPTMLGTLTAEQLATFQQPGMPVFTPEMLALFQNQAGATQAIGPDGQPIMQT